MKIKASPKTPYNAGGGRILKHFNYTFTLILRWNYKVKNSYNANQASGEIESFDPTLHS